MKTLSTAIALVAISAVPALAAKPPKPPGQTSSITITASTKQVVFGRSVTISGTTKNVPAGTQVELQQNPYPYTSFKASGLTGVVDSLGNYRITGAKPGVHTWYRVVAKTKPPTTSTPVGVRVRMNVWFHLSDRTPKRGTRVRFYGTAAPEHDGKPVLLQKKTRTGYKTFARTTLRDNGTVTSKYSKRLRIRRSGTWRVVVVSQDPAIDNGRSRGKTLRVHG